MKKLVIGLLLCFPILLSAQGFEGVIKFSLQYAGDQADQLKMMAPSGSTVTVKGANTKVVSEGGMMSSMIGDVITKGDEKMTYYVNASNKTVYKNKTEDKAPEDDKLTVKKEKKTATILGYKCTEYTITDDKGNKTTVWATTEIDLKGVDYRGKVAFKGVDGVILKMVMSRTEQGMAFTITMTCISFEKKAVNDSEFAIPSDYTVKEGVPDIIKMQGGK